MGEKQEMQRFVDNMQMLDAQFDAVERELEEMQQALNGFMQIEDEVTRALSTMAYMEKWIREKQPSEGQSPEGSMLDADVIAAAIGNHSGTQNRVVNENRAEVENHTQTENPAETENNPASEKGAAGDAGDSSRCGPQ